MSGSRENVPAPLLLGGATATGKSELAMVLARRLDGEIVSVDSMQVYRGLDIGTAKPGPREREEIPHHLIDVVELNEPFDAAKFQTLARAAAASVQGRGRVPILCGGTGLYFRAFAGGLGEAPASDPELRRLLEGEPLEKLLTELREKDPVYFEKVDRQNPRRVIRAIEAIRLTGRPFSALRASWPADGALRIFVCQRPAEVLELRLGKRVERMFAAGLVEETRRLLARGLRGNRTAMQAIGYRQVVEYLEGERSLAETIALVKLRTRQFAKRQLTWFRREPGTIWVPWGKDAGVDEIAGVVERLYREGSGDCG